MPAAAVLVLGLTGLLLGGCARRTDHEHEQIVIRPLGVVAIQIEQLEGAIKMYRLDHANRLPADLHELEEPNPENGWPYVDGAIPADPWGNEYVYVPRPDGTCLILSYGADGEPGGEGENADISNESLSEEEG